MLDLIRGKLKQEAGDKKQEIRNEQKKQNLGLAGKTKINNSN